MGAPRRVFEPLGCYLAVGNVLLRRLVAPSPSRRTDGPALPMLRRTEAEAIALRLDIGIVWVNEYGAIASGRPSGGLKQSDFGAENGLTCPLEFTAIHTRDRQKVGTT